MKRLLNFLSLCCFITAGAMAYAYVYDVDPIPLEREYRLEKEIFDRSNDNWSRQFPDFQAWLNENEAREVRFHEWLVNIANDAGAQFADIWEPGAYDRYKGYYADLTQGQPAQAPENWAKGEP